MDTYDSVKRIMIWDDFLDYISQSSLKPAQWQVRPPPKVGKSITMALCSRRNGSIISGPVQDWRCVGWLRIETQPRYSLVLALTETLYLRVLTNFASSIGRVSSVLTRYVNKVRPQAHICRGYESIGESWKNWRHADQVFWSFLMWKRQRS